jgi:CheY-like chemotaxis protein
MKVAMLEILIIDDDSTKAKFVEEIIRYAIAYINREGFHLEYRFNIAITVDSALKLLDSQIYHLIIVDYQLKNEQISGQELVKAIRCVHDLEYTKDKLINDYNKNQYIIGYSAEYCIDEWPDKMKPEFYGLVNISINPNHSVYEGILCKIEKFKEIIVSILPNISTNHR